MSNSGAKQTICNLYGLLMEANINKPDNEILTELNLVKDDFVEYQLTKFKQSRAKYNAIFQKSKYSEIIEEFNRLRSIGIEKLKELFTQKEELQLEACFRKFEELTTADEKSIIEDQELILFIKKLKERIDNNDNSGNS